MIGPGRGAGLLLVGQFGQVVFGQGIPVDSFERSGVVIINVDCRVIHDFSGQRFGISTPQSSPFKHVGKMLFVVVDMQRNPSCGVIDKAVLG